jgi:hypothetical protein
LKIKELLSLEYVLNKKSRKMGTVEIVDNYSYLYDYENRIRDDKKDNPKRRLDKFSNSLLLDDNSIEKIVNNKFFLHLDNSRGDLHDSRKNVNIKNRYLDENTLLSAESHSSYN